ncbi:basic-Leucine zipper transcription factor [Trichoderma cornu-damae]|uniref:Basic-Leucine zipper transcription factor n=1 Tax=Trichoderma cornu-damae TaxID=654480 RepID=A0A9P8TUN2_9HYPO|nr:basic-Leucine zipper transcription factor [Trichoderma cornu-damae]
MSFSTSQPLSSETTPRISTPPGTVDPSDITTASAPPAKKKKLLIPVNPGPLREEDDWTKVKDPKEKKRIQNRVAQRTYHRHERNKTQQATPDNSDSSTSNGAVRGFTAINQMPGVESSSPSPMPHDKTPVSQLPLLQPTMYEQPADGDESMFPPMSRNNLNSPPQAQSPSEANGLLSPPGHTISDPTSKVPHDFVLDCLRFQTHLLNRLNSLQQEANFTPSYAPSNDVPPQVLEGMTQAEQVSCVDAFSPAHAEAMEFSFDGNMDVWKADTMCNKIRPSPASNNTLAFSALTAANTPSAVLGSPAVAGSNPGMRPAPRPDTRNASLDERIEGIMEIVQAAGFGSFDALVSAYYCDTFGETSPLANEQRLSRNRRLPKVIDDVFRATKQWSSWERRGFQEEILKTAEAMLTSEGAGARSSLLSKITPLLDSYDATNPAATAEALVNLKRSIQEELPNSWALTMALASDSRNSWQRDRSNTALATTLLINFSGRMPNDQLLQILGACL